MKVTRSLRTWAPKLTHRCLVRMNASVRTSRAEPITMIAWARFQSYVGRWAAPNQTAVTSQATTMLVRREVPRACRKAITARNGRIVKTSSPISWMPVPT